jgi:NAD(P)-dependent dehydrogenase (short-subunit alcohol dehydrogenase family)
MENAMPRRETRAALTALGAAVGLLVARGMRERHAIDLDGRVVLITGASRGLGLEIARAFAERGAMLALLARNGPELHRAQTDLADRGSRTLLVPADIRNRDEVNTALRRVIAHYGRLDVVVHNAGVITVGPMEHMTLDDYEHAMGVHYWAALYLVQAALPHLRRSRGGRIVTVTSIGGKVAIPHLAPYCGSKFALVGLSDALRAELAPEGIRVTTVIPGLMRTGSAINATFKGHHADEFTWFAVSSSLPFLSISARRAAMHIVEACRRGAPTLTIGIPARLAVAMQAIMPAAVAAATALAARLLPRAEPERGAEAKLGWRSQSRWAPSIVTALGNRAAQRNNETHPALPIGAGRIDG